MTKRELREMTQLELDKLENGLEWLVYFSNGTQKDMKEYDMVLDEQWRRYEEAKA